MILNSEVQQLPADGLYTGGSVESVETTVPSAADVLHFIQSTSNAATALHLKPAIQLAKHIPALSGNILELHFDTNCLDFATRLNIDFDKQLIKELKQKKYNLRFVDNGFLTIVRQEKDIFPCGIENIWIEYDAPFQSAPALFFDINKSSVFEPQSVYNSLKQITSVFGWGVNEKLLHFLEQVQQAGLRTVYYGFMFSRKTKSIRLTIKGIKAGQLASTFRRLGWKGNYRWLEKLEDCHFKKEQKLVVGVDFETTLKNRIGIEVFDDNPVAFAQSLYQHQHISKALYDLLSSWEQRFELPEHLSTALTQLHQRPVNWLYTRLNHFKFIIDSTNAIAVKGYLYYCF